MLRLPAPDTLNGENLLQSLANRGLDVALEGFVYDGTHLVFSTLAPVDEQSVAAAISEHDPGPSPATKNRTTIEDRLRNDLATVDTITSTPGANVTGTTVAEVRNTAQTAIRDLQRQVKDLARMNKRLIRQALRAYDSAD